MTLIQTYPTERRSTGNEIGSSFEQMGISEQIWLPSPSGFVDDKPAIIFEITPKIAPPGYQLNKNSGRIYATENGWKSDGVVKKVDPSQFVVEFTPLDNPSKDHRTGTKDNPLVYNGYLTPRFVAVDEATGQPVAGSRWQLESCRAPQQGGEWTCKMVGPFEMDTQGSYISREVELTMGPTRMDLFNRQAAPNCEINPGTVHYEYDHKTGQTTVYGAGVYPLDREGANAPQLVGGWGTKDLQLPNTDTIWAIPVKCKDIPVCTPADGPTTPAEKGFTDRRIVAVSPAMYAISREDGHVLEGSQWKAEVYMRDQNGKWTKTPDDYIGNFILPGDGDGISDLIPILGSATQSVSVYTPVQAPPGYTNPEHTFTFVSNEKTDPNSDFEWVGYQDATVDFNEADNTLTVKPGPDVTDNSDLVKMGSENHGILYNPTTGDPCKVEDPDLPGNPDDPSDPDNPDNPDEPSTPGTSNGGNNNGGHGGNTGTGHGNTNGGHGSNGSTSGHGSNNGNTANTANHSGSSTTGSTQASSRHGGLANTGASVAIPAIAAIALIAAGAVLIKRRRNA